MFFCGPWFRHIASTDVSLKAHRLRRRQPRSVLGHQILLALVRGDNVVGGSTHKAHAAMMRRVSSGSGRL